MKPLVAVTEVVVSEEAVVAVAVAVVVVVTAVPAVVPPRTSGFQRPS